jgi:hypothetical protein
MRISGTAASLAGLEQGLESDEPTYTDHAIARLLLIHSVIISVGGIPLLYLGDEILWHIGSEFKPLDQETLLKVRKNSPFCGIL